MIKVELAKEESRKRDEHRYRALLTIGKRKFHLSVDESISLMRQLSYYLWLAKRKMMKERRGYGKA